MADDLKYNDIQDIYGTAECRRTLAAVGIMMAIGADQIRSIVDISSEHKFLPPVLPQEFRTLTPFRL